MLMKLQSRSNSHFTIAFWPLIAALSIGFSPFTLAQEAANGNKILVLFDTNALTTFKQSFSDGLALYLRENLVDSPELRISYEFLGMDDFPTEAIPDVLVDMLAYKQRVDPASVIISALSPINALSTLASELYPDLPVVYLSPNPDMEQELVRQGIKNAVVLSSAATDAIRSTMKLIPMLLPEIERLYVISGDGEAESYLREETTVVLSELDMDFDVSYLTGLPVAELIPAVTEMAQASAILLLPYRWDTNGVILPVDDVYRQLIEAAAVPVFTASDFIYQDGITGGSFTSSEAIGRRAAEMAVAIHAGEDAGAGSVMPMTFIFDQRQLLRWGIDEGLLPANSIIENQQLSFLALFGPQFLILLVVVGVALFIVGLLRIQAKNLREQKNLFEAVINSIPDAIFITGAEGKIFETNKAAGTVFGYSREKLKGRRTQELIEMPEPGDNPDQLSPVTQQTSIEPKVLQCTKENGETFAGETIATDIISESGEMLGHFALVRDISKRLSLEEEQRQGQKMEALGELVGGISHDFNNVLGVISGYAELSLMDKEIESIAANQSKILKATDRAKTLIAQIMTFSRDTTVFKKPLDLAALLDETMKLVNVSIPSSIETVVRMDPDVKPILGSAIQLQQIIINLTTNANQAMKTTGGSISIVLERKQVSTEITLSHGVLGRGNYTALSIADTGPGMSTEVASRIFEPYFTTKPQGEGSGMGMAIVYKLVKDHHAMLDLDTVPFKGTRVTVYFKEAGDAGPISTEADAIVAIRGQGEHILLVDDEEGLLDSVQQLLSSIDYRVTAFSDPRAALEAFRQAPEQFDILVSDQSMPKLTGIQLLRKMRTIRPAFPVIICTGYSDVIDQDDINHLDLDAVLKKPFGLGDISRLLQHCLQQKD